MKSLGVGAQICALSSLFVLSLSSCTSGSGSNDPPPPPPPPPELEGQGNFLQGVDDDGFQAANGTSVGGISDNGRWVVLTSADNLDTADQLGFATTKSEDSVSPKFDPGFTQGYLNVFVRDRDADGDNVLDETGLGETDNVLVSFPLDISPAIPGNGDSFDPQISADGRFVFFKSTATNLIPGDTNGIADIFVYDRDADEDLSLIHI